MHVATAVCGLSITISKLAVLKDTATYSSAQLLDFDALPEAFRTVFQRVLPSCYGTSQSTCAFVNWLKWRSTPTDRKLADHVRAMCGEFLTPAIDSGKLDLVASVARHLPILAIVDLVGAPLDRAQDFGQWAHDRATLLSVLQGAPMPDAEESAAVVARATTFTAYLEDFVEARRAEPGDDLTTRLIQAEGEPGEAALTTTEVVGLIATILSAGTSTTANFIPTAVYQLLRHDHWTALVADPSLIPKQWRSRCGCGRPYVVSADRSTHEVEINGCPVPAGSHMYLHPCGAASRDERTFPDPDRFDPKRTNAHRHLAFGRYKHLCLGAPLARLESRIVIELMVEPLPGLRLAEGWEAVGSQHLHSGVGQPRLTSS